MLSIFVRKESAASVQDVKGDTAGVGLMGMMGNKVRSTILDQYWTRRKNDTNMFTEA